MIVTFSIIYLVSVVVFYKMVQKQHSRGGRFNPIDPTLIDVFFMFLPFFNTVAVVMELIEYETFNMSKFFRIKK